MRLHLSFNNFACVRCVPWIDPDKIPRWKYMFLFCFIEVLILIEFFEFNCYVFAFYEHGCFKVCQTRVARHAARPSTLNRRGTLHCETIPTSRSTSPLLTEISPLWPRPTADVPSLGTLVNNIDSRFVDDGSPSPPFFNDWPASTIGTGLGTDDPLFGLKIDYQ